MVGVGHDPDALKAAAIHGHLNACRWLAATFPTATPTNLVITLVLAACRQHYHVCRWVITHFQEHITGLEHVMQHLRYTNYDKNPEFVRWLGARFNLGPMWPF